MRRILVSLLVLAAVVAGILVFLRERPPPIEILAMGSAPKGLTDLDLGDSPTYRVNYQFRMEVVSRLDDVVGIAARLENGKPEDLAISLHGETEMLPAGSINPTLVIKPPKQLGPFSGTVRIYSDDVPDWEAVYTFHGKVVEKPREGRWISVHPLGVDLGEIKPGESKPFVATVRNEGSEDLTVREWRYDPRQVKLHGVKGGEKIAPGGELQMGGSVRLSPHAPPGPWFSRVEIFSDATNAKRREFRVSATIVRDHTIEPGYSNLRNVFPQLEREVKIIVRAREGVAPFQVASVRGVEDFFEAVSLGSGEDAGQQTVVLRVRRDAPTSSDAIVKRTARLLVEPPGVELVWNVEMRVLPSIYAQPPRLRFGRLGTGSRAVKEILLSTFAGRKFRVKHARAKQGFFVVEVKQKQGMTPTLLVRLADNMRPGFYRDVIEVETDDPETKSILIEVTADLK